ncbi:hypothetical protein E3N88_00696 [Mikania micrantha]|uniref:DUF668 domain-containing protein n=1 Tax=Mikania micrantha TaxID=192012 RepID=A0A5N6Q1J1_9ASTR|nr:hypothetical protein E3N88_00696 [Mikania micrantha]
MVKDRKVGMAMDFSKSSKSALKGALMMIALMPLVEFRRAVASPAVSRDIGRRLSTALRISSSLSQWLRLIHSLQERPPTSTAFKNAAAHGGICGGGGLQTDHLIDTAIHDGWGLYRGDDQAEHAGRLRKTTSYDSGELFFSISRELKPSISTRVGKAPHVSTFLGKAGSVGLEVLDTLGSSMTNLNSHSGFVSNSALRGNKVSILAFEVANTIVRGSNLMQSLSDENIQILKKEILHSKGVQYLVSTDMKELLKIAAADKREEFEIFSREVVRFGDMCKDPQWHNLDRFFARLDLDFATNSQLREEAEITMHELVNLAQHTSELYHEWHTLDRFEQDYRRKLEEAESLHLPRKGESLMILQSELKHQRKVVRNLKKKSLWSKSLEEIVEKLVDDVISIHQAIAEAFEENASISTKNDKKTNKKPERLGVAGLALHYANLITQMDNIASRPTSLPPNMRDTLYNGLPASVKAGLRSRLQALDPKEVMSMPKLKAEMEKTLQWLVPVATDTTKAHQGFGWVGEWANTGYVASSFDVLLTFVICLLRMLKQCNFCYYQNEVSKRRTVVPGVSKSQEFVIVKKKKRVFASSRSMGSSPPRDFKHANVNMLDVLDGLGTTS